MQTIIHLQIIIGYVAALFSIVVGLFMAALLMGANFKPNWPPDWFSNAIGAAMMIAVGFGLAEGFLALTRYAIG